MQENHHPTGSIVKQREFVLTTIVLIYDGSSESTPILLEMQFAAVPIKAKTNPKQKNKKSLSPHPGSTAPLSATLIPIIESKYLYPSGTRDATKMESHGRVFEISSSNLWISLSRGTSFSIRIF